MLTRRRIIKRRKMHLVKKMENRKMQKELEQIDNYLPLPNKYNSTERKFFYHHFQ